MLQRVRHFLRRRRLSHDIEDEFHFHLEQRTQENIAAGMAPDAARRAARLSLGNPVALKEETREVWTLPFLETLWQDVRYGLRQLRRSPGFAIAAIATLALGIGANTAIFSVVSLVLMKKPAVRDPDRVMSVVTNNEKRGWFLLGVSAPDFEAFDQENDVFEGMAAAAGANFALTGQGKPDELDGARVTTNYFQLLGVQPSFGRSFSADEGEAGRDRVTILSWGLWEQHFAANPNVIGSHVDVDGEPYTVIGVMPPGTESPIMQPQLWTPLVFSRQEVSDRGRNDRFLSVFARLKPHVTVAQARAEIAAIASRVAKQHPSTERGYSAGVLPLQQYLIKVASVETSLAVLLGAVVFVLLIACANIAGLLLARAAGRGQEMALRAALGARRRRVIRQLLTESLLIALGGGGLGVALGIWGIAYLRSTLNWNRYVAYLGRNLHLDARTLFFAVGLTLGATLLFGLVPALQASKSDLAEALKEGGRAGTQGRRRSRLRAALVAGQIALSVAMLAGAGFMIQGFIQMMLHSTGMNPRNTITARINLSSKQYQNDPAKQADFFERVMRRLREMPGVESASAAQIIPLEGYDRRQVKIDGQQAAARAGIFVVGAGYFRTMGIPLIRGREFSRVDDAQAAKVAIVNRAFAQRYFPSGSAIGQRILVGGKDSNWADIVGVVGNVKEWPGQAENDPQVYEPFQQRPVASMALVVRTGYDASSFAPLLRDAVWLVDKNQPVESLTTMRQVEDKAGLSGIRFMAGLTGVLAVLALLLSAIGIYGVVAYSVAKQKHEIAIRVAIGAQDSDVLRMILKQGALLAAIGCGIGVALALALNKVLASMFGAPPGIQVVLPLAGSMVALVALLATYIPARRATRVDPVTALKYE